MSTPETKTDDSKLVTTHTVYVSPDGGTTDEAFPKPNPTDVGEPGLRDQKHEDHKHEGRNLPLIQAAAYAASDKARAINITISAR
jgi:hypothetical protein